MPTSIMGTESIMPIPAVKTVIKRDTARVPKTGSSTVSQLISGLLPILGAASISSFPEGRSRTRRGERLKTGYWAEVRGFTRLEDRWGRIVPGLPPDMRRRSDVKVSS